MAHVTLPIEPGSRWRHFRCADTPEYDVVVLAVVEYDGATWIIHGDTHPRPGVLPDRPHNTNLTQFVTKYSEVKL